MKKNYVRPEVETINFRLIEAIAMNITGSTTVDDDGTDEDV